MIGAVCLLNLYIGGLFLSTAPLVDLPQFYLAAKLMRSGQSTKIYDQSAYQPLITELKQADDLAAKGSVYFNRPAFELLLFLPLSFLPYNLAAAINLAINGALLGILIWKLPQWFSTSIHCRVWLLVFMPFLYSIALGQDTLLLALILATSLHLIFEKRDESAGAILALAVFKPHLIFMLPIAFAAAKRWKLLRSFLIAGSALALLSLALVGPQGMRDWIAILRSPYTDYAPATMGNFRAIGIHFGVPIAITVALTVSASFAIILKRGSFQDQLAAAIIIALLLSPHTYAQDYSVFAVAALISFPSAALYAALLPWPYFYPWTGGEMIPFALLASSSLIYLAARPARDAPGTAPITRRSRNWRAQ
jgi:hypothetical protein